MARQLDGLSEVIAGYDVVLCDVWGVLHNGVKAFDPACKALQEARKAGATIILLTNSPRPTQGVVAQLREIGVSAEVYDRTVTSGDVTRHLIASGPRNIFLIGPDRDLNFFDGLDVQKVSSGDAECIVCTGFFDDHDVPEDYTEILTAFAGRNLPLICANPDLVVKKGDNILPCAGAIAAFYEEIGGVVSLVGKPHPPIYLEAFEIARQERGQFDRSRILAIGDGMSTDVKGALSQRLDLLFIADGVHAKEYSLDSVPDNSMVNAWLNGENAEPAYWMSALSW